MQQVIKRGLAGVATVTVAATLGIVGATPAGAETIDVDLHGDTAAPLGLSLCVTVFDTGTNCILI